MKRMIRFILSSAAALFAGILVLCSASAYFTPSHIIVSSFTDEITDGTFPVSLRYKESVSPVLVESITDGEQYTAKATVMLFDTIPIKDVEVEIGKRRYVDVSGKPFGIRLYTDGLVVSSLTQVLTGDGQVSPAGDAGIRAGDIIRMVNGKKPDTSEQLSDIVEKSGGKILRIEGENEDGSYETAVKPVKESASGRFRIGLMVRDSCAGIGTMTFTDKERGIFAGLGHGICDNQSGSLMPLARGDIVPARIDSVRKGGCGSPGSLAGSFTQSRASGTIVQNADQGIYGSLSDNYSDTEGVTSDSCRSVPVLFNNEVVRGKAKILTTVDGEQPELYDAEIEEISYNNRNTTKNMVIKITDDRLLSRTGGIVRGMSGSPILQNGRLAGAVTHVFVNDPTRGYGVFAGNMIVAADKAVPCTDRTAA